MKPLIVLVSSQCLQPLPRRTRYQASIKKRMEVTMGRDDGSTGQNEVHYSVGVSPSRQAN